MTYLYIFYALFVIMALGYVVVNTFHFIRFRLPLRGDLSLVILVAYLLIVASVLIGSFSLGLMALNT